MNSPLARTFVFGSVLVVALMTMSALGTYQRVNLLMVDWLFNLFPNEQATPPILLVSTSEADRSDPQRMAALVTALQAYGPRSIHVLEHWSRSDATQAQALVGLEGVTLVDSTAHLHEKSPDYPPLPASFKREFMTRIDLLAGHFRLWNARELIDGELITGFQAAYLEAGVPETTMIDLSMEDGFLPSVKANRVLAEGLASSLVHDRHVLIGETAIPGLPRFNVPLRPDDGITELELQGYVLHSVLSQRFLRFTTLGATLGGMLAIMLTSLLILQWLPSHLSFLYVLLGCLALVFFQWVFIRYSVVILPTWNWITAELLVFLAVIQLRRLNEEVALNQIIATTNSRLSERILPPEFNDSIEPWKKVLSLVNQQLNIKRSIFLEKVPKDHRVREVEALNCSIDDISERRRDYEREPYSDALEANAPKEPFRDYFNAVEEGEIQYIVPLSFGGDVMGFWALTLVPVDEWNRDAFEGNVRSFAAQIAELFYHRAHWRVRKQKSETLWRQFLSAEAGLALHTRLTRTVELMEHRLNTLEDVFNGLSTAVVVYDVFGQVLHTNDTIENLARENEIAIYKMTAMDLLAMSNQTSLDEARNKLRYVTLKQQTLIQNSRVFANRGSHMLYVRPVLTRVERSGSQVQPFRILGILFEFTDLTRVQQHDEIRQDITSQYFSQLRRNFNYVDSAARGLLERPAAQAGELLQSITDKVHELGALTDRVDQELNNQKHMGDQQVIPTNVEPIIMRLVEAAAEDAENKQLTLNFTRGYSARLSLVEVPVFEQLMIALLEMLMADANRHTTIDIRCDSDDPLNLQIMLENSGHGLPQEQLEQALSTYLSLLDISEDPLTRVSVLAHQVPRWGGAISLRTSIGGGFAIRLRLETFNLSLVENTSRQNS